jgi:hypothetical protein
MGNSNFIQAKLSTALSPAIAPPYFFEQRCILTGRQKKCRVPTHR